LKECSRIEPVRKKSANAATGQKMAGIPDEAIRELHGHTSVRTTQEIYMHLAPGWKKRGADKMDEILGPVVVNMVVKIAKSDV
jgi:hypothetical protein